MVTSLSSTALFVGLSSFTARDRSSVSRSREKRVSQPVLTWADCLCRLCSSHFLGLSVWQTRTHSATPQCWTQATVPAPHCPSLKTPTSPKNTPFETPTKSSTTQKMLFGGELKTVFRSSHEVSLSRARWPTNSVPVTRKVGTGRSPGLGRTEGGWGFCGQVWEHRHGKVLVLFTQVSIPRESERWNPAEVTGPVCVLPQLLSPHLSNKQLLSQFLEKRLPGAGASWEELCS